MLNLLNIIFCYKSFIHQSIEGKIVYLLEGLSPFTFEVDFPGNIVDEFFFCIR